MDMLQIILPQVGFQGQDATSIGMCMGVSLDGWDYGVHVKGTGFLRAQPGPVMSSNPSCIAMDGLRYGAVYMYTDPPKLIRVSPSRSENNFDGFHPLIPSVLLFRPLDFCRTCQRSPRL